MNVEVNPLVAGLEESATEIVDNEIKRMKRLGVKDIVSLGVGEPYFDTPEFIKQAAIRSLEVGNTKYQATFGDLELRKAIQEKLANENRVQAELEDIMVTPGAKFALYLAFQALIRPGDKVAILDPSWVSHASIPQLMGAELLRVETVESEGYQPDLEKVESALKQRPKCIILNSPCNPTGAVYSPDSIRKITSMARDNGTLVISDEIYESLLYEGEVISPASEFDNVFTVNGFSKRYAMTGWRLGYACGPHELMEQIIKIYQHSASCVTAFAQAGALEALTNPAAIGTTKAMVDQFNRNRQLMMENVNNSKHLQCVSPRGAFYCFVSYDKPVKSLDLARDLLSRCHLATVPGGAFGLGGEYHLRLSYATSEEQVVEGLKRLNSYFDQTG
ncbi:MAG TPA: pyridoxal phosphate-dependent aminotransferase [Anaerolineaceae bacterium]|nr:pyridoxal phosphate-dependent aminotransferase [Anaerolineaceae bacterium]